MILIVSNSWTLGGPDLKTAFDIAGLRQSRIVNFEKFRDRNWPQVTMLVIYQHSVSGCQRMLLKYLTQWTDEGRIGIDRKIVVISNQPAPNKLVCQWHKIVAWQDFKNAHELAETVKPLEEKDC